MAGASSMLVLMPPPPVRVEREGPVTVVVIDRPERRNAIDAATASGLSEAFLAFDEDPDAAVAVLVGAGDTFCAGADLKAVAVGQGNRVTSGRPGATRPDPARAVETGGRRHRGLCRSRRPRAGHLVRPPGGWAAVRRSACSAGVSASRWSTGAPSASRVSSARAAPSTSSLPAVPSAPRRRWCMGLVDRVVPDGRPASGHRAGQRAGRPPAGLHAQRPALGARPMGPSTDEALGVETRLGLESLASAEARAGADPIQCRRGTGWHGCQPRVADRGGWATCAAFDFDGTLTTAEASSASSRP